jgi:hypothetical protein
MARRAELPIEFLGFIKQTRTGDISPRANAVPALPRAETASLVTYLFTSA